MNLWAKSLRRLAIFSAALFFFSCEDETSYIGFKNPKPKFNVSFIEIPLESSVLSIDSVITDNAGAAGINYVGQYDDPLMGSLRAETYMQMYPASTAKIEETAVYDSVTFQVRVNFSSYGFTDTRVLKFNVHELTGDTLARYLNKRYYFNSTIAYNPQTLAQLQVNVSYDSLRKELSKSAATQDTLLISAKLDDNFGARLFEITRDPDFKLSDQKKFIQEFKGLVLTPTESNGMLGLHVQSGLSKVTLHYHTMNGSAVGETLQKNFLFTDDQVNPNFTNYSINRGATELSSLMQPHQSFAPASGLRAVQSGAPLITKLDLRKFYAFADTIENVLVNSAELVISDVQSPSEYPVHGLLLMKVMHTNDEYFANDRIAADSIAMMPYSVFSASRHYYVRSETSASLAPASLQYDSDNDRFSGFITIFVQSLFQGKAKNSTVNPDRIRFIGLHPMSPGVATSVNRTVFNANNIKLRIYYTKPAAGSNNNN